MDHVATVRQARRTIEPDPVEAALASERGGADGITVHLREDRRHIQDDDVRRLAQRIRTVLNLELATSAEIVSLAEELKPHQVTFVPENRQEITTEGGLNLNTHQGRTDPRLVDAIERLRAVGIRVSLFIDPDPKSIDSAAELKVEAIELHTGEYANATTDTASSEIDRLVAAATRAKEQGLAVHAGHGLTYNNVSPIAALPQLEELNIGHSVVSRSILTGMETAVREMRQLIDRASLTKPM